MWWRACIVVALTESAVLTAAGCDLRRQGLHVRVGRLRWRIMGLPSRYSLRALLPINKTIVDSWLRRPHALLCNPRWRFAGLCHWAKLGWNRCNSYGRYYAVVGRLRNVGLHDTPLYEKHDVIHYTGRRELIAIWTKARPQVTCRKLRGSDIWFLRYASGQTDK